MCSIKKSVLPYDLIVTKCNTILLQDNYFLQISALQKMENDIHLHFQKQYFNRNITLILINTLLGNNWLIKHHNFRDQVHVIIQQ